MWPWSSRRRQVRAEQALRDREGIEKAEAVLARVEADDEAVDAVHAEHERLAERDAFGESIAAALRLRRET